MELSRAKRNRRSPTQQLIIHRDVNGKALALVLILSLMIGVFYLALAVPPHASHGGSRVAHAQQAEGEALGAALRVREGEDKIRALDYCVPRKSRNTAGSASIPDILAERGLLRGYSVPPRRIAFTPDGGSVIMPPSPTANGPQGVTFIFHGTRDKKRIALTFDTSDVAEPVASRAVIEELTRLRTPATIFVCGGWCVRNPELLRMAVARGFEIANHSYSHPSFTEIPDEQVVSEIKGTEREVERITGSRMAAYFRPPYGACDERVLQLVARIGYATAMWTTDTMDWSSATTQSEIRDRAISAVRGGDIVLMHTLGRYTPAALAEIVGCLRAAGFELTTLSGVLQP